MTNFIEIYSHISAVIVTLEIIVMGVMVRKAWKYTEGQDGEQRSNQNA